MEHTTKYDVGEAVVDRSTEDMKVIRKLLDGKDGQQHWVPLAKILEMLLPSTSGLIEPSQKAVMKG